ncbi:COG2246 Predicted membrane protein [Rhabdaerophilaceae bacterium]
MRQFAAFFGVGLIAAIVHYGLLIALVELGRIAVIPATLAGYVAGGFVSYVLNRALTYDAQRGHAAAGWRFTLVAGVGFGLTWLLMGFLHGQQGIPYLLAQVITTGIVLIWSFLAHKFWSFGEKA